MPSRRRPPSVINPMMGVVQAFTQLRSAADIAATHVNAYHRSRTTRSSGFVGGSDSGTKLVEPAVANHRRDSRPSRNNSRRYQGGDLSNVDNAFGEIATLMKTIAPLKQAQKDVADALGHFAVLSAQYGPEIANKLYDLEQNYNKATGTLANNSAALGILKTSFDSSGRPSSGGRRMRRRCSSTHAVGRRACDDAAGDGHLWPAFGVRQ
jgi:hypothetical protein